MCAGKPGSSCVPRYATAAGARAAAEARERAQAMAAESGSGIPLDLVGLLTPLPADGGGLPAELIEHDAHAVGHAAVVLAGDMLRRPDPLLDPGARVRRLPTRRPSTGSRKPPGTSTS
ncbi:hypothetical protein [Amycolatopsis tolypomycina]|uniref:hypothetical protein n=1 Tax=Amycolatopsis tolypomycina TaxID=208445 RepID=UPI00339F2733